MSVANTRVAENSGLLLNTHLYSTYTPPVLNINSPSIICMTNSVTCINSMISVNSIKQDKAWMLRKIVTVGRRKKFS